MDILGEWVKSRIDRPAAAEGGGMMEMRDQAPRGAGGVSPQVQSTIGVALLLLIFGIVTLRALLS
jgi:hypothetical protein